jgi:hypothetical protein
MSEPRIWHDLTMIAEDLQSFANRVYAKLDDMERLHVDNLILHLDKVIEGLPRAIHAQIMQWRTQQQEDHHTGTADTELCPTGGQTFMADLKAEYPTLFYHTLPPGSVASRHMERIRVGFLALAEDILTLCPTNRSRSLALTELEYSLMRAIQSLAMTGDLVDPRSPQEDRLEEEGR